MAQRLAGKQLNLGGLWKNEPGLLLIILAVAAAIWGFAAFANEVMEGDFKAFDKAVLLAMRQPQTLAPIGAPAMQEAVRDVTGLGGTAVLTCLTLAAAAFLLLDGKRRMAFFVIGSVFSGMLLSVSLKSHFNRPRPDIVPHATSVANSSFPSGHSMMSALTYLTLGALLARSQTRRRLKAFAMILAATLTLLVGLSRVYLGVHWPTDVFAGWTAGASWALLCWFVARILQSRHTLEAEAEHSTDALND